MKRLMKLPYAAKSPLLQAVVVRVGYRGLVARRVFHDWFYIVDSWAMAK